MDQQQQAATIIVEHRTLKERVVRILHNPLYVGMLLLFAFSAGSSVYVVFGLQSASLNPHPKTLPTLSATPSTVISPSISVASPTASPSASTPTPTPDPTISWKLFSNPSYKYTIKYPSDWVFSDKGLLESLIPDYVVFNPATASATTKSISISYTTRTASQLQTIYGTNGSILTILGHPATEYDQKDSDGNQSVSITLPLVNYGYVFYAQSQYKSILLQMIGTLILTP